MNVYEYKQNILNDKQNDTFNTLYGDSGDTIALQKERYIRALDVFLTIFPDRSDVEIFSAPGRTEIGGNHTDHQHGVVLASAVNLDIIGVVSFHNDGVIRVKSEGYEQFEISPKNLSPQKTDSGTALIAKGILSKFLERGIKANGFDVYCTSDVISGGGISSSAAFETLICTIIDSHYNNSGTSPLEIARIGQFAENVFFGKRCGLLDQTVSSLGGLLMIDFNDDKNPVVEKIDFNFNKSGYSLCITDTKSSHKNLTEDYDSITNEMREIADFFVCDVLNDIERSYFYENIANLRRTCSDRAILRAIHFFDETVRAKEEAEALKANDFQRFLKLVNESGNSSCELLQNLYSTKKPLNQEIPLAIAISKKVLKGRGAVRVHGGGFAGTIQAFVPHNLVPEYKKTMDSLFGNNSCIELNIRPFGGIKI